MEKKEKNKDEKWKREIGRKKKAKKTLYIRKEILNKNSLARSNPISMQGRDENKWIDKGKN